MPRNLAEDFAAFHNLEKSRYKRRWKGPGGKWQYEYEDGRKGASDRAHDASDNVGEAQYRGLKGHVAAAALHQAAADAHMDAGDDDTQGKHLDKRDDHMAAASTDEHEDAYHAYARMADSTDDGSEKAKHHLMAMGHANELMGRAKDAKEKKRWAANANMRSEYADRADASNRMAPSAKKSMVDDFRAFHNLEKGGGEGSRGGHVIGHTSSGKPIYSKTHGGEGSSPTHADFMHHEESGHAAAKQGDHQAAIAHHEHAAKIAQRMHDKQGGRHGPDAAMHADRARRNREAAAKLKPKPAEKDTRTERKPGSPDLGFLNDVFYKKSETGMSSIDDLDAMTKALLDDNDLVKAKYTKRTGTKGHYRYYYKEHEGKDAKGHAEAASARARSSSAADDYASEHGLTQAEASMVLHEDAQDAHRAAVLHHAHNTGDSAAQGAHASEENKHYREKGTLDRKGHGAVSDHYAKRAKEMSNVDVVAAAHLYDRAAQHASIAGDHEADRKHSASAESHYAVAMSRTGNADEKEHYKAKMRNANANKETATQMYDKQSKQKREAEFTKNKDRATARKTRDAHSQVADMTRQGAMSEKEANERRVELEDRYAKSEAGDPSDLLKSFVGDARDDWRTGAQPSMMSPQQRNIRIK
jgi:hypothetical protein